MQDFGELFFMTGLIHLQDVFPISGANAVSIKIERGEKKACPTEENRSA